jgi:hypothetical protein
LLKEIVKRVKPRAPLKISRSFVEAIGSYQ